LKPKQENAALIRFNDALTSVEDVLSWLAVAILIAITLIVSGDVVMRYLFNRPFSWAYDLISFYLMAALFYAAVSRTFSLNAHIGVDLIQRRLPLRLRLLCQLVVGLLATGFFAIVVLTNFKTSLEDFVAKTAVVGEIPWPSWVSTCIVVVGSTVISVRLVLYVVQNMLALFGSVVAIDQLNSLHGGNSEGARGE
jgi:TRAP-type C4-dicarboxylate transport system permease small subunit